MDTKRKLIELIKNHSELYNTTLSEYKDIATRNEAWNHIAEEMEMSVEESKTEWVKLRNCYVNALRRRVSLQNREGRTLPPWLYETEMSFLKPFMTGRGWDDTPYTVLLPEHSFSFDVDLTSVNNDDIQIDKERKRKKRHKSPKSEQTFNFDHEDSTSVKEDESAQIGYKEIKRKKLKTPKIEIEDDTYEILNTNDILETSEPYKASKSYQDIINDTDESDLFFLGLSQTFKKLPKIEQCRLKMDIFKIINDAEMRQLGGVRVRKRRSSSE